jgi:ATP adenylyltransferase
MKVLWAPWRMHYVKNARKPAACIFCLGTTLRHDAARLVLHRSSHGFVIMNRYPYNSGHLLIAPYAHVKDLESLPADCALDLIRLTNLSIRVLRDTIGPEGFNVGLNLGRVSGAGIEAHVHLHIVPRWNGDSNFMSLLAETRVIPEHLRTTYAKLHKAFASAASKSTAPTPSTARRAKEAGRTLPLQAASTPLTPGRKRAATGQRKAGL